MHWGLYYLMLIYTTMRNVQGEDKDRLLVSILVSASHPEEADWSTPVPHPHWAPWNSTHQTGLRRCHTWVYDVRVWMTAERFPARKQGLKWRAEESQTLLVTIEKSRWYIPRWWTAKVGVPVKCRESGSLWWVGKEMGVGGRGLFWVTMSKATTER